MAIPIPDYPTHIIPRVFYKKRISLDEVVNNHGEFFVCRRISQPIENFLKPKGKHFELSLDCLEQSVVKLSMNLMGIEFTLDDLSYRAFGKAAKDWDGKTINIEEFDDCYEKKEESYPLFYSSTDLHRIPFNHELTNLEKGEYNSLKSTLDSLCLKNYSGIPNSTDVEFEMFVGHAPNKLNYYHVMLEVKPAIKDDDQSFKNDNSWRKDIYAQKVSDILRHKYLRSQPNIKILSPCYSCSLDEGCKEKNL